MPLEEACVCERRTHLRHYKAGIYVRYPTLDGLPDRRSSLLLKSQVLGIGAVVGIALEALPYLEGLAAGTVRMDGVMALGREGRVEKRRH